MGVMPAEEFLSNEEWGSQESKMNDEMPVDIMQGKETKTSHKPDLRGSSFNPVQE